MSASSVLDTLEEVQSTGHPPRALLRGLGNLASWASDVLWHIERMSETDWRGFEPELEEAYHRVEMHQVLLETLQALADLEPEFRELLREHRHMRVCAEEALEAHHSTTGRHTLPPPRRPT